jgi:hypothetical protein
MNYKCEECHVWYFDEDLTTEKIKLEAGNINFCSLECAKKWILANVPEPILRAAIGA